ncbi:hypothetical protein FACS1894190_06680 [Spirochaetia bacterium]|nr:hypothetical protein FACS1894190_06680 [Spirochaetia bacterium]
MRKLLVLSLVFIISDNVMAQDVVWKTVPANPSQYKAITKDELWKLFDDNKLVSGQKFKIVFDTNGYLTETQTILALLADLSVASSDAKPSSKDLYYESLPEIKTSSTDLFLAASGTSKKHLYYEGLPKIITTKKYEVLFSRGVSIEKRRNGNMIIEIPIIHIDGYRIL